MVFFKFFGCAPGVLEYLGMPLSDRKGTTIMWIIASCIATWKQKESNPFNGMMAGLCNHMRRIESFKNTDYIINQE